MLSILNNKNQPLSRRFAAAYTVSKEASPSNTDDDVKEARKALQGMKKEFTKKIKDVDEVCEAAVIVGIPERKNLCAMAARVHHDKALLVKELARVRTS
jgi:hypothetical protein